MSKTRIKVTMNDLPKNIRSLSTNTKEGREIICSNLWRIFDSQVKKSRILTEYSQKGEFESPGEKRRRKNRKNIRDKKNGESK